MPARMSPVNTASDWLAGPMVQTILVRRMFVTLRKRREESTHARKAVVRGHDTHAEIGAEDTRSECPDRHGTAPCRTGAGTESAATLAHLATGEVAGSCRRRGWC